MSQPLEMQDNAPPHPFLHIVTKPGKPDSLLVTIDWTTNRANIAALRNLLSDYPDKFTHIKCIIAGKERSGFTNTDVAAVFPQPGPRLYSLKNALESAFVQSSMDAFGTLKTISELDTEESIVVREREAARRAYENVTANIASALVGIIEANQNKPNKSEFETILDSLLLDDKGLLLPKEQIIGIIGNMDVSKASSLVLKILSFGKTDARVKKLIETAQHYFRAKRLLDEMRVLPTFVVSPLQMIPLEILPEITRENATSDPDPKEAPFLWQDFLKPALSYTREYIEKTIRFFKRQDFAGLKEYIRSVIPEAPLLEDRKKELTGFLEQGGVFVLDAAVIWGPNGFKDFLEQQGYSLQLVAYSSLIKTDPEDLATSYLPFRAISFAPEVAAVSLEKSANLLIGKAKPY